MSDPWRPRRFWTEAKVEQRPEGFAILLDGRELRTPSKQILNAPNAALAEAAAEEWRAQGERLAPETMPLTRALNLALDRLPQTREAVIDDAAAYGGSDALAYRAEAGELVDLEREAWTPCWIGRRSLWGRVWRSRRGSRRWSKRRRLWRRCARNSPKARISG